MTLVKSSPPRRHLRKRSQQAPRPEATSATSSERGDEPWYLTTAALSMAGMLLLWAAFPPLGFWPLAWVAPWPWLALIGKPSLGGKRPYAWIWLSSALFWIATLEGIRHPHWINYLGLLALGAYYALFFVAFFAIARWFVQRWRVPLIAAVPIAWIGLEFGRGLGPLGLSLTLIGHTQIAWLQLIQVADIAGGYGVGFCLLFVSSALATCWDYQQRKLRFLRLIAAVALLAVILTYGQLRLGQPAVVDGPQARVALLQGTIDTKFDADAMRVQRTFEQYRELTERAAASDPPVHLIVWPESMFPLDNIVLEGENLRLPRDATQESVEESHANFGHLVTNMAQAVNELAAASGEHQVRLVLGCTSWELSSDRPRRYNAAMLVEPDGAVSHRYYKMHPVLFGEYLPFGELLPWIYDLSPMRNGLTAGRQPNIFTVAGVRFAPSICFESTVPQLVRRQVKQLAREGRGPDVLLNITNDGWFWGSSLLDQHLNCAAFRALENRTPMLVAANTGITAAIDGNGRVLQQSKRRTEQVLMATVSGDPRSAPYHTIGEWPAVACFAACLAVVAAALGGRLRRQQKARVATD